jgi:uncharacterized protein (TIGR00299 family) protein
MKTLYLDIFSGISGDMFLGAMIDLGLDLAQLEQELGKLGVPGYHVHATRRRNAQIEGVKFDVHITGSDSHPHLHGHDHNHSHGHTHPHEHEHADDQAHAGSRNFKEIRALIQNSPFSDWVKRRAVSIFERVAAAEGKVHGQPPEEVHFHEVGAIDSIVDIVGACIALEAFGYPRVLAAPVVEGTGWVNCAHGRFPVPTTATLEILGARGIALTQCEEPSELVTPTGAALLAEFVEAFGPMRHLVAEKIGYGLGTRQNKTRPNVLRAVLGEERLPGAVPDAAAALDWETDVISVVETNLDDCPAEWIGFLTDRALAAGALDVFHTPIQMKKNRPGILVTVLCQEADADRFSAMLLEETSAFGVRRSRMERRKLRRENRTVSTPFGEVSVKLGKLNGRVLHASPEFETCKRLALERDVTLKAVYEAAVEASRGLVS